MAQKIEFELAANDSSAKSAWERQQKSIDSVIEKLGKLEGAGDKVQRRQSDWLSKGAGQLVGMVSGFASVTTAINLMGREYDSLIQRQTKSLDLQKTLADAQRSAVLNLGGDATFDASKLVSALGGISKRTGVDEKTITMTASDALSARGDMSVSDTLKSVEAAARLMPNDAESQKLLAAASMDLGKATGASPESTLGFLQSVGAASRVTSLKFLAENVTPGITGISKFGGSEREAGALLAALSGSMVDTTGAQSKTTGISLAKQLETFLPGEGDTEDRIRKLQSDDRLRKGFLAKASFEAAAVPTVRGLLSGDANTPERRAFEAALAGITDVKAGAPLFEKAIAEIEALPAVRNSRMAQSATAAADALLAGNTLAGTDAAARESVAKFTEATGGGIVDGWRSWGGYQARRMFGQSPSDAAANTLAGRAASLEAPTYVQTGGLPGASNRIEASAENRESAAALREAAAAMREAAKGMVRAAAKEPVKIVKPDVPVTPVSVKAGR